jgi:hypothetical protein
MNPYSRQYLRERYLAEQQAQMAEDAKLDDPAVAYEALLAELDRDAEAGDSAGQRAA